MNVVPVLLDTGTHKQAIGCMKKNIEGLTPKMVAMLKEIKANQDQGKPTPKPRYYGHQTTWRNLMKRGLIIEEKGDPLPTGILTEEGLLVLS